MEFIIEQIALTILVISTFKLFALLAMQYNATLASLRGQEKHLDTLFPVPQISLR